MASDPASHRHLGPPRSPSPSPSRSIDAAGAVRPVSTTGPSKRLRRTPADTGSVPSSAESNGGTCQQVDISHGATNTIQESSSFEKLPEDMVHHIHSLLDVQDAARASCVSRVFLRSWRCYSYLVLDDQRLGLTDKKSEEREIYLINKVDQILKNHYANGVKLKALHLCLFPYKNIKASYLNRWLQNAVQFGIEDLGLVLYPVIEENSYSFPCSVLSDKAAASSIQTIFLVYCTFHPTSTLGCLKRLKSLDLSMVQITEEGLGHLLSKSFAIERLVVNGCNGITSLRIPCTLEQLKLLHITTCEMMQVVEIDAPNLCTLHYSGGPLVEFSVRYSSQLKNVNLWFNSLDAPGILSYARARLPYITPNVGSLTLCSHKENVDTPILSSKFINLKKLEIGVLASVEACSPSYDAFSSPVSFLDASPVLDSFILWVEHDAVMKDPLVGDDKKYSRRKRDCRYNSLRQVTITNFNSAESLVELTIHILESAPSLQRLILDTTNSHGTCTRCRASGGISGCCEMSITDLAAAHKAVEVAGRYIAGRVPSGVEFQVLKPCNRCHTGNR